jgi:hypothetical protein
VEAASLTCAHNDLQLAPRKLRPASQSDMPDDSLFYLSIPNIDKHRQDFFTLFPADFPCSSALSGIHSLCIVIAEAFGNIVDLFDRPLDKGPGT